MVITRAQLLQELMPGINALFGLEYSRYSDEISEKNFTVEVDFEKEPDVVVLDNKTIRSVP